MDDNHPIGKPTVTPASLPDNPTVTVLLTLSALHQMTFHITKGLAYLMDTGRTQIHTPQHLNPHPMEGNLSPWNLTIPEVKLIPPLTLQTNTTTVMMDLTHNLVAQMDLVVLEVLEVQADPATTLPMSNISCRNS